MPWEEEDSSVSMERNSGPLPLHRRVAPLTLEGEGSSVLLERDDGSLPLQRMCGPLQFEGEEMEGRAHCHWMGKMPFANDTMII